MDTSAEKLLESLKQLMDEGDDVILSRREGEWVLRRFNFWEGYTIDYECGSNLIEVIEKFMQHK